MFTGCTPEEAFAEKEGEHATPSHFWCNCTQTAVGKDDCAAHPQKCSSGRGCFEE